MSSPVSTICGTCGKRYTWIEDTIEECPYCARAAVQPKDEWVWVGRTFYMDSAHHIVGHEKCGLIHGHTWKITVRCFGKIKDNGMVIDLHDLKKIVEEELSQFDHKLINDTVAFERGIQHTCENLCTYLLSRIYLKFAVVMPNEGPKFMRIRVQEGEGGWAETEG